MAEKFSYDLRLKVVQEALKPENRNSVSYIAEKYGINAKTLRRWIRLYNQYGEESLKPYWRDKSKDQRIKELERENAELREEAEILKKAAAFLADAIRK
jgi:transposase